MNEKGIQYKVFALGTGFTGTSFTGDTLKRAASDGPIALNLLTSRVHEEPSSRSRQSPPVPQRDMLYLLCAALATHHYRRHYNLASSEDRQHITELIPYFFASQVIERSGLRILLAIGRGATEATTDLGRACPRGGPGGRCVAGGDWGRKDESAARSPLAPHRRHQRRTGRYRVP